MIEINYNKIVSINERATDDKIIWEANSSIDGLAKRYYGSEKYWRVIMMANQQYSLPFDIKVGDIVRIPLPFDAVIEEIENKINNYSNL